MGKSDPLRVVLIGMTGSGKSSLGNTILREKKFTVSSSSVSVTKNLRIEVGRTPDGRRIEVVDLPGLFDTEDTHKDVAKQMAKAVKEGTAPGPSVVIFVTSIGRFTEQDWKSFERTKKYFGEDITNHMIVVFTRRGDLDEDETVDDYVRNATVKLKLVLDACGRRYVAVENKERGNTTQVEELIQQIDSISADGRHYRSPFQNDLEKNMADRTEKAEKDEVENTDHGKALVANNFKLKVGLGVTSTIAVVAQDFPVRLNVLFRKKQNRK